MSAEKPPAAWQRVMRRIAGMPPLTLITPHAMQPIDQAVYRLTDGRHTGTSLLTGLPVVHLTTKGAKSGLPRTVPLIGFPDGDKLILIASNWGNKRYPAWYHNLRADSRATVEIGGEARAYTAREASGQEKSDYWEQALRSYPGYEAYRKQTGGRPIPIMVLTAVDEAL